MTKKLLITFDYELFLGMKSGSVKRCLILPTEKIIETFKDYNLKLIFFVDTTYLIRLKEISDQYPAAEKDYKEIVAQLQRLLKLDYYIFPHIHPHWSDAVYHEDSNQWTLDNLSKYRFHALDQDEKDRLFKYSLEILKEIIYPVNKDYKIDSYRAGGWSVQPFRDFKPYFKKYGLKNDFSVSDGLFSFTDAQYFDFRNIPANEPYFFEDDILEKRADGSFKEYPISSVETNIWQRRIDKALRLSLYKFMLKPLGNGETANAMPVKFQGREILFDYDHQVASLETFKLPFMYSYFQLAKKNRLIHLISHPKLITAENLKLAEVFLNYLYSGYNIENDFRKF